MIKQYTIVYRICLFVNRFFTIGFIFLPFLEKSRFFRLFHPYMPLVNEKSRVFLHKKKHAALLFEIYCSARV